MRARPLPRRPTCPRTCPSPRARRSARRRAWLTAACASWLGVAHAEEAPAPPPPAPTPELLEFLGSWRGDDMAPAELLEMLELWPDNLARKADDE